MILADHFIRWVPAGEDGEWEWVCTCSTTFGNSMTLAFKHQREAL